MKNQIEKIDQMNLEVISLINQLTSKPRLVESQGVKIRVSTITGIEKIEISTSLENLASGKTEVNLD